MRFLLVLLLLTGCSSLTSRTLVSKAIQECKDVPMLDGERTMCVNAMIQSYCDLNRPDLEICGIFMRSR